MSLDKIGQSAANQQPLTAEQQKNLSKLHETAQQMESLFVNMLFTEMRKTTSQESLTGKASQAEQTFQSMLDEKYSEDLAKTGSLGLGKMLRPLNKCDRAKRDKGGLGLEIPTLVAHLVTENPEPMLLC